MNELNYDGTGGYGSSSRTVSLNDVRDKHIDIAMDALKVIKNTISEQDAFLIDNMLIDLEGWKDEH